ncbi:MFS transporter [Streptomyces odontomachi]|uniref:MFS transporter n=1 Tax=Streptomyces odontomachi TaxID=2944940 RepID=UPI00210AD2EF|nr:MFS transporter [Streptomyces sp. ODS25]
MSQDTLEVRSESDAAPAGVLRTLRELPRSVVVLLCGVAINRMGSFITLFLVLYLTGLGYRPAQAGIVLTAFGVGSIAGVVAGGSAAERLGYRSTIAVSMVLSGLCIGSFAFVTQYGALLLISCLAGAVTQVYVPAASAMLAELTPRERLVMTTAVSRLSLNIGATAAPLLGVWLAGYGYPTLFLVDAATSVVFGVVALLALPGRTAGAQATAKRHGKKPGKKQGKGRDRGYAALLHDRRYLLVVAAIFLTSIVEVQVQAVLPLEIQARDVPTAVYGVVVALNGALVIALELPLTRFTQRLRMTWPIAGGTLAICGGIALFGLPGGAWVFFLGALIWTSGEIICAPSVLAYPGLIAPPRLRSRYIGALSAGQIAGIAVGPSVGTTLFQYGNALVWLMCAALGAAGLLATYVGVRGNAARL